MELYIPTIGIDYGVKPVTSDQYEVRINFFDMAGPDEYGEIRNEFYADAQACLLAYDISDACTFVRLRRWVEEMRRHSPTSMVCSRDLPSK